MAKWRSFVGAIIALALMFFTTSFASAGGLLQPMPAGHSIEASSTSQSHMNNHDAMQMTDNDCCDDDNTPCGDNDCDMPCMNFSVSHAVLASKSSLLHAQSAVINIPIYNIKDGISGLLSAPPPRA